jgi:hypothetical protein
MVVIVPPALLWLRGCGKFVCESIAVLEYVFVVVKVVVGGISGTGGAKAPGPRCSCILPH